MYISHNQKTVTLKLKRIDICDLLLACTLISAESDATKWDKLHDKLEQILIDFDEKNFTAEGPCYGRGNALPKGNGHKSVERKRNYEIEFNRIKPCRRKYQGIS